MKPCLSPETINRIMRYHTEMIYALNKEADKHKERVEILKEYQSELSKPGCKQRSAYIKAGTTAKGEHVVTESGNTYKYDYQ